MKRGKAISPEYLAKRVVEAKRFIDTNYFASLDLNQISRSASFSSFHFLRLFKKTYKKTPASYLRHKRLEEAKKLLETTHLTVKEICFRVGFESQASFNLLFKKTLGMSPGEYRQSYHDQKFDERKQPLVYIPGCYVRMNKLKE